MQSRKKRSPIVIYVCQAREGWLLLTRYYCCMYATSYHQTENFSWKVPISHLIRKLQLIDIWLDCLQAP